MRLSSLPGGEFRSESYRVAARTPFFSIKVKPNGGRAWRIGIVAGMAVDKSAVKRNFWKRQARESARYGLASGSVPRDVLILLSSRTSGLTKKTFREKMIAAAGNAARMPLSK